MKVVKVSRILKLLKRDGWVLARQKGSHRQFTHPVKSGTVTVNGGDGDDVWGWLLNSIEEQSGLKF